MTNDPRSMVGPVPGSGLAKCQAALDAARGRTQPAPPIPRAGPSRSTACTHPYVEETADPDQVVCVLCATVVPIYRPDPQPDPDLEVPL